MRRIVLCALSMWLAAGVAWAGPDVIPEMQECMRSHGSRQQYEAVLKKYSDPGLMRRAMGLLVIKDPRVVRTDERGPAVCYTVEGTTVETSREFPSDALQTYYVCWQNRKIVSLEFYGAKPLLHDEIIAPMRECMRSHGSRADYEAVLKKYADPGIIRQALGLLVIKEPHVVHTERKGPVVIYTVQGRTVGTSSEIPADVDQVYRVGWMGERIVSLEFLGPGRPGVRP